MICSIMMMIRTGMTVETIDVVCAAANIDVCRAESVQGNNWWLRQWYVWLWWYKDRDDSRLALGILLTYVHSHRIFNCYHRSWESSCSWDTIDIRACASYIQLLTSKLRVALLLGYYWRSCKHVISSTAIIEAESRLALGILLTYVHAHRMFNC